MDVMDALLNIDKTVFYFINRDCHHEALNLVMPYITEIGSGLFIFAIALILLFFKPKRLRMSGLLLMAGLTMTYQVVRFLKNALERPRPFFDLPDANALATAGGHSFPSNHAAMAFMAAFILSGYFRKEYIFYTLAVLVALSRVYLGVHYPSDVFVGGCIGLLIGYILEYVSESIKASSGTIIS
ncbi:phosphatase PAP2 family protein [Candidatus Omnitrophota bacterium]